MAKQKNTEQSEFIIKNLVRSALVAIGTAGIPNISYFKPTFGENSANMEYFLGGVAALLLYDRERRHPNRNGDKCFSNISVKTLSELFQIAAVGTSFWYNPKCAAGVLAVGCLALTACKGMMKKDWNIFSSCHEMVRHLSCHQITADGLKPNNNR